MRHCSLPILFEDKDLIAVNKPAGLLSVPIKGASVVSALFHVNQYLAQRRERALVVHRIDRYTSGLVLFAKGQQNHELLRDQFQSRAPQRKYLAVIEGRIRPPKGELRHYLKLNDTGFKQMLSKKGEEGAALALLHYEAKQFFAGATLVEVSLDTGLKNQIRVQFAVAGHPLIGERQYVNAHTAPHAQGLPRFDHQALHAASLEFEHPQTHKLIQLTAPIDEDMKRLLQELERGVVTSPLGIPLVAQVGQADTRSESLSKTRPLGKHRTRSQRRRNSSTAHRK